MPCLFVVAARMLKFGRVTAQHFSAGLTNAKMYPTTIYLDAFFTAKYRIVGFGN
jgi:hypothetical protein